MEDMPKLRAKFAEPQHGFWDGGKKDGGDFHPAPSLKHPGAGKYIRWGSFELNFWFTAKAGRSWKEAANAAKKKLTRLIRIPATVEINWKD